VALRQGLFIDGVFVESLDGATLEVLNPHDGTVLATIAEAGEADVDRAVEAATRAFPAWSSLAGSERGRRLLRLADAIEDNASEFARLESLDTGHPIHDTTLLDVPRAAATFRYFGGMADKFEGNLPPVDAGFLNYVLREPIGVVAQIVPWNFPLMFCGWKLGPALAAGNTVVMKPSELVPLSTLRLCELFEDVGIAPGVVNVIPGYGARAGAHLAAHPGVGKVSFTGSTRTGRSIVEASAGNLKRLQLELGGKGANIVFDDADLTAAVIGSAFAIFHNQGQACIAGSRLIVQERIYDEFVERFVALASSIRLGDPMSTDTEMGPLTSAQHRDRVLDYVKVALEEGGEILTGGAAPQSPELAAGYYVAPTVVRANPTSRVCFEEVFGPFVTVSPFRDEAEALAIANATDYGLGAGLWTRDLSRAHRAAAAIRSGMVWINCYKRVHPASPFGGVRSSGYGREMGFDAMHEYTEAKSIWLNVDAKIPPWYPRAT
jgi:acyl-CoA reductase-like NAD-dependent aldehyde dehydrogenase